MDTTTPTVFRRPSGQTFTPASGEQPCYVYSTDDLSAFCLGDAITDNLGNRYSLVQSRFIAGRLYELVLIPLLAAPDQEA